MVDSFDLTSGVASAPLKTAICSRKKSIGVVSAPLKTAIFARRSTRTSIFSRKSTRFSSSTARAGTRTTLTLSYNWLLRGCTSAVLLDGFGRRFRSSAGGAGVAGGKGVSSNKDAEAEYAQSFEVEELDAFLSHSWHANWFLKYAVLLFWFNGPLAALFTLWLATLVFFIGWRVRLQRLHEAPSEWSVSLLLSHALPWLLSHAFLLFSIMFGHRLNSLQSCWHRVFGNTLSSICRHRSIFLDKVCIHQTDLDKKKLGIVSIGAFLGMSRTMLLTWDPTYFQRLWCMYELSAFRRANPNRRIVVLPVQLGGVLLTLFSSLYFKAVLIGLLPSLDEGVEFYLYTIPWIPCMAMAQGYVYDINLLLEQVDRLSIEQSACFCCDNGHVNPIDGQSMLCDRKIVHASIAEWYGQGDEARGIEVFNASIRASLKHEVAKSLGTWAPVSYKLVVVLSMPNILIIFQYLLTDLVATGDLHYCHAGRVIETAFLRTHFRLIILFCLARFSGARSATVGMSCWGARNGQLIMNCLRAVVMALVFIVIDDLVIMTMDHHPSMFWILVDERPPAGNNVTGSKVPGLGQRFVPTLAERVCDHMRGNHTPWEEQIGVRFHGTVLSGRACLAFDITMFTFQMLAVVGAYYMGKGNGKKPAENVREAIELADMRPLQTL